MPEVTPTRKYHRQSRVRLPPQSLPRRAVTRPVERLPSRRLWPARPTRPGTEKTHRTQRQIRQADSFPLRSVAFITATCTASTRLICPAPIASVRDRICEDDGVGFDMCADAPRKTERAPFQFGRRALRHNFQAGGCEIRPRPGRSGFADLVALLHQHRAENRSHLAPARRHRYPASDRPRPRACWACPPESAAPRASTPGAITASMKVDDERPRRRQRRSGGSGR